MSRYVLYKSSPDVPVPTVLHNQGHLFTSWNSRECARIFLPRCPYLHRTAGDTERRYHLRYYKTSTCVYETDSRGYCVKNGPHCAFAHGPHDLRGPVYDIRELQGQQDDEDRLVSPLVGTLEREKGVLVDDTRWQGKCPPPPPLPPSSLPPSLPLPHFLPSPLPPSLKLSKRADHGLVVLLLKAN